MQNDRELKSLIEGLLYVWGDPLPVKDLAEVAEIPVKTCRNLLEQMKEEMEHERRGLVLLSLIHI